MLIANFKLRITNSSFWVGSSLFLCLLFVFSTSILGQNPDTLAEIINRGSVEQKRDALSQIRNLQTAEASRIAVPALKDSAEIVRATAVFSIVYLPPDEALAVLSPNLQDKSALVRRETAYALGKVGNRNATDLLLQLFQNDKIIEVKNAAVVALGEIGDVSAVAELIKILQRKFSSKEDFLRRSAARSIGQIAQIIQTGETKVLTPEIFLREKSVGNEILKYENSNERLPIFQTAATILIQILQTRKEADDVRREAAFALGTIADKSAAAVLRANLNAEDYYLAEICREALLKLENN